MFDDERWQYQKKATYSESKFVFFVDGLILVLTLCCYNFRSTRVCHALATTLKRRNPKVRANPEWGISSLSISSWTLGRKPPESGQLHLKPIQVFHLTYLLWDHMKGKLMIHPMLLVATVYLLGNSCLPGRRSRSPMRRKQVACHHLPKHSAKDIRMLHFIATLHWRNLACLLPNMYQAYQQWCGTALQWSPLKFF